MPHHTKGHRHTKGRHDMKMLTSSKKGKLQGILGIILLAITITALGLYTGSQPGRKPMLNWQAEESIERYAASRSSGFEMTGNAVGVAGNAAVITGDAIGITGNAAGIAGNAAGITGNADRMVVLAGNAAGIPGNAAGMAGLAEDDSTTEKAVRMEDEMAGAVTGMAGIGG